MNEVTGKVVVGVDGSTGSDQAVVWAAELAAHRNLPLRIVHALHLAELYYGGGMAGVAPVYGVLREEGARMVNDALKLARAVDADLAITTGMPDAPPIQTLLDHSQEARMIVVGRTGIGGFAGMLLGSTAAPVAAHARCPVVVVRGREGTADVPETGPVVVGIDGSPVSEKAIAEAFEEASWRTAPLVAVHVWSDASYDSAHGVGRLVATEWQSLAEVEERLLAQRLAGWQERYPDVEIRREVVRDRPRDVLLERSAEAQLVVVGSRGRGGFRGMLLGSTSGALVQHAGCPVLVVRPD